MQPCSSCGYSSKQGATIVSFVSTAHFIMQLIVICIFGHATEVTEENQGRMQIGIASDEGFYGLIACDVLLIFMSILLFVGVRYYSICMILPWVVTTAVADVSYFTVMVATFIATMTKTHHRVGYLVAFISSTFIFGVVSYLLWVVIYFLLEILAQPAPRSTYQKFGEGPSKEGQTSSSKSKGKVGKDPSRLGAKSQLDVKETPVNKYLLRDSD